MQLTFTLRALVATALMGGATACGSVQLGTRNPGEAPPQRDTRGTASAPGIDPVAFYRERGFLAHGAPMAFTGSVAYAAAGGDDSTHIVLAVALSADALTFRREGDAFRADYRVTVQLRRDSEIVASIDAAEAVRVATLRETSRADESVLFQQILSAAPGGYSLSLEVRDVASGRAGAHTISLVVPSFATVPVASPIPVYDWVARVSRAAVPRLVVNPAAAIVAGRDSVLTVYIEAYTLRPDQALNVALRVEDQTLWTGTVTPSAGSDLATAVAYVPLSRIALGTADVLVWPEGARDTSRASAFVGFADDLPVTTYSDMLAYLVYFTSERRLQALRQAPPRERGEAWKSLMRATDPVPGTPDNEALQAYFARMRQANGLYAESGVEGWRSDRGMVLLILGEPDRVLDQFSGDAVLRGRLQHWEYRERNITIVFEDAMGLNRWRITRASEAVLAAERERRQGSS